jgi:antitoxin component HigA of HigAB toxin-antitoxin module
VRVWTNCHQIVTKTFEFFNPARLLSIFVCAQRLLLEQQGLTQRDLIPEFGSESGVPMF